MKKRTKVLIAVAAGLVVLLLLAGTLLLRPPVPYQFLEGASYEGTMISHYYIMGPAGSVPKVAGTNATREYRLDRPFSEVDASAGAVLSKKRGWIRPVHTGSSEEYAIYHKTPDDIVEVSSTSSGTLVRVTTTARAIDHAEAWLWSLTHEPKRVRLK